MVKKKCFLGKTFSTLESGGGSFFLWEIPTKPQMLTYSMSMYGVEIQEYVDSYWIANWLAISSSKNIKVTAANRHTVVAVKLSALWPHSKWSNTSSYLHVFLAIGMYLVTFDLIKENRSWSKFLGGRAWEIAFLQAVQQPTYQAEKKQAIVQWTIGITDNVAGHQCVPVSYTHLTLPTIYSV